MPDIRLTGCSPAPLASYLKGLAVLRLVAEQADPEARGAWENEGFTLRSLFDTDELVCFLLERYAPTPIVAPWNGGSGFNPKDNQDGIGPLACTHASRLQPFRKAIESAREIRLRLGIEDKAEGELKLILQQACRAGLPDEALAWFDAAIVLTPERPSYPALLGTGGNDGRLDFSNNFMQRVVQVIDPISGKPTEASAAWLRGALFGGAFSGLKSLAVGQFDPGNAGGANGTSGFEGGALVNPWDFVLMLEGALLFAAASSKRLGGDVSVLACPFSVDAVGVGYPSAAARDESKTRNEMWMPLWSVAVSLPELRTLMAEGRAEVGMRKARNAVDFARAVATLGVDRGLTAFQRFAFHERNGQSYLALPLERYKVGEEPRVELLSDLDQDGWLESIRRSASTDTAPASLKRAVRCLDAAIVALCRNSSKRRLQELLVAVGSLERALARTLKWTRERFLRPCPSLSEGWLVEANDDSPTWRLAVSLAGIRGEFPLRCQLEPVSPMGTRWEEVPSADVVWHDGGPVEVMNLIVRRRILQLRGGVGSLGVSQTPARLADVARFVEGGVDPELLFERVWGLMLVRRGTVDQKTSDDEPCLLSALYGLMALSLHRRTVRGAEIPLQPEIHNWASRGDSHRAASLAIRRLRGSGLPIAVREVCDQNRARVKRCAAAVLFPLGPSEFRQIVDELLLPENAEKQKEVQLR